MKSGTGKAHESMAAWARSRDPRRLLQVCICVCVRVCVCVCERERVDVGVSVYVCMYARMYIRMCVVINHYQSNYVSMI